MTDRLPALILIGKASGPSSSRAAALRSLRDDIAVLDFQLEELIKGLTNYRAECWRMIDVVDALVDAEPKAKAPKSVLGSAR